MGQAGASCITRSQETGTRRQGRPGFNDPLWNGLPTVPPAPTEGLPAARKTETFGRRPRRGQETRAEPRRRGQDDVVRICTTDVKDVRLIDARDPRWIYKCAPNDPGLAGDKDAGSRD